MTTSGTVGLTTIDATSVIEHAARRCGVLAAAIPAEVQLSARDNLFLILSNFAYKGMALWCVQKYVYALKALGAILTLDVGIEEVLNALCRTATFNAAASLATPGSVTYSPGTAVYVNSVALGAPAGSYVFVLEGSPDGVTWTQYGARTVTTTAASVICFDAEPEANVAFWRVRETLLGLVVFTSAYFITAATEIPMTIMARDTYAALPNKYAQGRPLQYWYDKQASQQRLWMWQVPGNETTYQAVIYARRQIQDVGDLTNTLDIPQRWLDPVISTLAPLVCLELPKELIPPGRYEILIAREAESVGAVLDAEVDNSPLSIVPNIRGYTA